jgi:hypothetical protein
MEHREWRSIAIVRFLELSDQPSKPPCKLIGYHAHFGR